MPPLVPPSDLQLDELAQLHASTRYLDAYHRACDFAPLEQWSSPAGLVLAGRLAACWGDWSRSNRLHQRAWQDARENPETIYYQALTLEVKHGPFESLRFLRERGTAADVAEPTRAQAWLWLQECRLLATFRDFEGAEVLLDRARPHSQKDPWWWVEQGRLREQQDRYEEALACTQEALRLRPRYRQGIELAAHLLTLINRDAEALAMLVDGTDNLQAGSLAQSRALLHSELEQHSEALGALDRAKELLPCADRRNQAWLASRRSDALRKLGRLEAAAIEARRADSPFHNHIAARLESAATGPRVRIPVPFVRQHHMTCAPATLTAIAHHWQQSIDHLELARVICYDGTPDHEERNWAEQHGWYVREFRVTWEIATALLDRGCPFTLTTMAPRSAHLQAVVGYDSALGLLIIRDPYLRTHGECIAESFLQAAASHGPRGMVLVPPTEAGRLAGLEFPDAALYDRWYAVRRRLAAHEREAAQAEAETLATMARDHRLTFLAQRELAFYDGNILRQLEFTRRLRAQFPADPNFQLDEVQLLRALGRNVELRAQVAALDGKGGEPLFLRERAEMLTNDARHHRRAGWLLRRVMRRRPTDPFNLRSLANLLWSDRRFADATAIYRLAACAGDKTELHWDALFSASRHIRQSDGVLALLRQRDARLGEHSSQPARTLFRALDALDRTPEGHAVLQAALARRTADGELQLYAAEVHGRSGNSAESQRLLAAAEAHSPRSAWLRVQARLADFRSDYGAALAAWRELLVFNPTDIDAHAAVVRGVAGLEGREAALAGLAAACAQHPEHLPLCRLQLEWLRSEPAESALPVVDRFLAIDPANAWALREKALILRRMQRWDTAETLAREALHIEPAAAASPGTLGVILQDLGRTAEARAAFEAALRLGIDAPYLDQLLATCGDFSARRDVMLFVHRELSSQPAGDGGTVLRFRELARGILPLDELRTLLETLLPAHPDFWAVWSALGAHLLDQNELAAGLARARESTERFPLVPRVWVDLATAQSRGGDNGSEIQSLRRALELSPSWSLPARILATAHERALELDAAEHVLRRSIAADPLDAIGQSRLGDLFWRRGRKVEGRQLMERAVTLDPGNEWAWERLQAWSTDPDAAPRPLALAEALARRRPGDANLLIRVARLQSTDVDAALASLARANALEPRNAEAHDLRAQFLAEAGRFEEALSACRPVIFGEQPPHDLLGRAAWIEHARRHQEAAIETMQALVAVHADYAWGWACLTEWLWEAEKYRAALEAATKWSWLAPWTATPLGYAAAAQQRLGHRTEAKELYWRALHVDPTYLFGAQALLQLLAEDQRAEEAAKVVRHIETHFSPADAQRAAVLYHVMRRDRDAAASALSALARAPESQVHLLFEAAKAVREAGWSATLATALEPLLTHADARPEIGRLWFEGWSAQGTWRKLERLPADVTERVRRQAWIAALEHLGSAKDNVRLRRYAKRFSTWLRTDAETWGSMGYAFVTAGLFKDGVRWLRDWPALQLPGVQSWMLHNLVLAHYREDELASAAATIAAALQLPPDHTRPHLLAWHALEHGLSGNAAAMSATLSELGRAPLPPSQALARDFAAVLVAFHAALGTDRKRALSDAKLAMRDVWNNYSESRDDPLVRMWRTRVMRHLARTAGSWTTYLRSLLPDLSVSRSPFGGNGWILWIAFVLLMQASRGCSGS